MIKAWMDECAARLQPLVDQYELIQQQTFAIEKFRDLIVTTRSCPGDKKYLNIFFSTTRYFIKLRFEEYRCESEIGGLLKITMTMPLTNRLKKNYKRPTALI